VIARLKEIGVTNGDDTERVEDMARSQLWSRDLFRQRIILRMCSSFEAVGAQLKSSNSGYKHMERGVSIH